MKENIEELKRLLYRNELSQYGKRKLINYYEQQEKDYKRALKENETYEKQYFDFIDKIENKMHNFNYLSETDWSEAQKIIDNEVANILQQILQELLESEE